VPLDDAAEEGDRVASAPSKKRLYFYSEEQRQELFTHRMVGYGKVMRIVGTRMAVKTVKVAEVTKMGVERAKKKKKVVEVTENALSTAIGDTVELGDHKTLAFCEMVYAKEEEGEEGEEGEGVEEEKEVEKEGRKGAGGLVVMEKEERGDDKVDNDESEGDDEDDDETESDKSEEEKDEIPQPPQFDALFNNALIHTTVRRIAL
jgi:hypothetical protein